MSTREDYERPIAAYPVENDIIDVGQSLCDMHGSERAKKRVIVQRMMRAGATYSEWYMAPVDQLAREVGLLP